MGGMGRVRLDLLDMRWKMSLRLGFDMICGKGTVSEDFLYILL
jgi:hypothetical protein